MKICETSNCTNAVDTTRLGTTCHLCNSLLLARQELEDEKRLRAQWGQFGPDKDALDERRDKLIIPMLMSDSFKDHEPHELVEFAQDILLESEKLYGGKS